MRKYDTSKSKALFYETRKYLLDGIASSFHKAPFEEYPLFIDRGKGSKVYDADGNEYIDYIAAMGPMILGFSPDAVNLAVKRQIERGSQFAASTEDLLKLSKKLTEIIPCAELVSYQNTGTEANMLAFRFARAYTGRNKIIKFEGQYHGWSDEEKVSADAKYPDELGPREHPWKVLGSFGQREEALGDIIVVPWNDIGVLRRMADRYRNQIAGIIMEPFMCDSGQVLPAEGYLQAVREYTRENGIVLIFDEVITGFRLALGGAQQYFGVVPDLAVFGKALTAGYSLSVVAGKREILSSGVHPSGTFNANPIAVAAALSTISELEKPGVYARLQQLGDLLSGGIRRLGEKHGVRLYTKALGSICMLLLGVDRPVADFRDALASLDHKKYNAFTQKALLYGVRFTPLRGRLYLSTAHSEKDIENTLLVIDQVFSEL